MDNKQQYTVTINLESDLEVKAISFHRRSCDEYEGLIKYEPSMVYTFDEPIEDYYTLTVEKVGDYDLLEPDSYCDFWLDGDNVIITGKIEAQQIIFYSVENSPMYNQFVELSNTIYEIQIDATKTKDDLNSYLLEQLNRNYDSPISREFSAAYLTFNYGDKEKLKALKGLIENQSTRVKKYNAQTLRHIELFLSN